MKKYLIFTTLLLCLLFSGCSAKQPQDVPSDEEADSSDSPVQQEQGFIATQGSGSAEGFDHLPAGVSDVVLDFLHRSYQSLGNLELTSCADLFSSEADAAWNDAAWHTLIALRQASLVDLRINEYAFTLTLTEATPWDDGLLQLSAMEDVTMYFVATPDVASEHWDILHTFLLAQQEDGSWKIESHTSDDTPYYRFEYDSTRGCDARLSEYLANITRRQTTLGDTDDLTALGLQWDHDYDRQAAYRYMQTYALQRNPVWDAYDDAGGNCQNFGSQVLLAGGIPMDEDGGAQWFWYSHNWQDYSWINVGLFMDYAKANTGYGLVSLPDAAYYTGDVGDILILGTDGLSHTTVISDVITDDAGQTLDYLLCSNTSNYRDFPASAYFFTAHHLVRILGWNE